ncbi:MAG: 2Fe-2S iron-sulfur cluster-binding protein, partial [Desulfotomaculales bacterium]
MPVQVIFQPSGRRGPVPEGITLLEAARQLGVDIESVCGSARVCGKCKVKIEEGFFEKFGIESRMGHLSPLLEEEKDFLEEKELADNYRLACCAEVFGDVLVFVPEESRGAKQVVLEHGKERVYRLNPAVRKYYIEVEKATLEDHRGDFERIRDALVKKHNLPADLTIDYPVLRELPFVLRNSSNFSRRTLGGKFFTGMAVVTGEPVWKVTVTVWNNREIILVEPGLAETCVGLAVDVGTTTVAAYLCDLHTGRVLAVDSMMNPQV